MYLFMCLQPAGLKWDLFMQEDNDSFNSKHYFYTLGSTEKTFSHFSNLLVFGLYDHVKSERILFVIKKSSLI